MHAVRLSNPKESSYRGHIKVFRNIMTVGFFNHSILLKCFAFLSYHKELVAICQTSQIKGAKFFYHRIGTGWTAATQGSPRYCANMLQP